MRKAIIPILSFLLVISLGLNVYLLSNKPDSKTNDTPNSNPSGFADVEPERIDSLELCYDYDFFERSYSDYYGLYKGTSITNEGIHYSEYYSFRRSRNNFFSCEFSAEKFKELINLINEGNPKAYEGSFDSDGRMTTSSIDRILRVYHYKEGWGLRYSYITCDNMDDIEAFFKTLEEIADKPKNN